VTDNSLEIERKFLVTGSPPELGEHPSSTLEQGYLAIHGDGTEVRIRRARGASVLTIKSAGGLVRIEEELPIDNATFERLWPLTEGRRIEKVRHLVPGGRSGDLLIEVDVYDGDLAGLVMAEVEFASEEDARAFAPPPWFGADVTHDGRFKNQRLAVEGRPDGDSAS
jgi:CYTH domain-containing protein